MAGLLSKLKFFGLGGQPAEVEQEAQKKPESMKIMDFIPDFEIAQAWMATYQKAVSSKQEFLKEMSKIQSFYLVDALARNIVEDALTPDVTTGEVIQLSSGDQAISAELQHLQDKFDFDQIISDIALDLIRQGEHVLRVKIEKGEGVTDLLDDMDQKNVVAFYKHGFPYVFLTPGEHEALVVRPPYAFAHFAINKYKLRIQVSNEFGTSKSGVDLSDKKDFEGKPLPTYTRVGRSVFYGVLSKIKELMLIELLVPTKKLNDILKGNLVTLQMPPATLPKDAFEACRKYERFLNKKVGINKSTDEFSVADIVNLAGSLKVLPTFSDKGELRNVSDVKQDRSLEAIAERVDDNRKVICSSIGYPPELLYGGEGSKGEILKRYARYVRVLKGIQTSIAMGAKQIALIHLVNKGFTKVSPRDIDVSFRNELVKVDELDKVELFDAVIGVVDTVKRVISEFKEDEHLGKLIDMNKFQAWLYRQVSIFGGATNFIKEPPEEGEEEPEPEPKPEPKPKPKKKEEPPKSKKGGGEEEEEEEPPAEEEPEKESLLDTLLHEVGFERKGAIHEKGIDQRVLRDVLRAVKSLRKADTTEEERAKAIAALAAIGAVSAIEDPRFREHAYMMIRGIGA